MTRNARWLAGAIAILPLLTASASHAQVAAATPEPATPPASGAPQPSIITRPDWLRRPTGAEVNREYPKLAAKKKIEGRVTLRCIVTATGALNQCWVTSETPGGYGFGDAALRISKYFQMRPKTVDGVAVGGAFVNIGLPFRLR